MAPGKLRVAVIGAGACGLCAARHLLASPATFAPPVVFEASAQLGGTWVYTEETGQEGRPVHSSMYQDLRTNLPKEVMAFPDFPFEPSLPSFLHHSAVLDYLQRYAETFHIREHIRFQWQVDDVQPLAEGEGSPGAWAVKASWQGPSASSEGQPDTVTEHFDAVMVCTGHYSVPFVPTIPGLDSFPGLVLHSHSFRRKDPFAGLSEVVLVGGGPSGVDLALLLSDTVTGRVVLSHRRAPVCGLPPNVAQVPPIARVGGPRVVFEDGSEARPEALVLCTGYRARFPFLALERLGLREEEHGLAPLYRHLLPPRHPTLFLLGLCQLICPFPHFHCQALFALAVLAGRCPLPSAAEMEAEARAELDGYLATGGEPRHFLWLQERQWSYAEGLAQAARSPSLPTFIQEIWAVVREHRAQDMGHYRDKNYRLLGPDSWEVVEDSDQNGQAK
ncbi:uncharacterized protein [Anolis sagrei]|uniref:uncharacterized protein n=1 Tax=Anolis sagrei TaxID=38937 RepID=UPI003521D303